MRKLLVVMGVLGAAAIMWPSMGTALEEAASDTTAPGVVEVAPTETTAPEATSVDDTAPAPADEGPTDSATDPEPTPESAPSTTVDPAAAVDDGEPVTAPDADEPPAAVDPAITAGTATPDGAPQVRAQACEPSYPTICLPPGVDVDCDDIPQWGNFEVRGDDPFRLDGNDDDGIGCEGNTNGLPSDPSLVTTTVPTTAPPTTAVPTTAPPITSAPQVAGTTQTRAATALPVTGGESRTVVLLGVLALTAGLGLLGTGGYATRMVTARPGGGFTLTLTNPFGEHVVFRVTSRSKFGRLATWWSRRRRR